MQIVLTGLEHTVSLVSLTGDPPVRRFILEGGGKAAHAPVHRRHGDGRTDGTGETTDRPRVRTVSNHDRLYCCQRRRLTVVELGEVIDQLGLGVQAVRAILTAPWLLVYPIVESVFMVGIPVVATGILVAFVPPPAIMVAVWASMFVAIPIGFSFAMVAYCHELDAALTGRRPMPGSGFAVAVRRFKRVVAAGLVAGTGAFAVHYAGETIPFADSIGVGSTWGLRIAGVFAFPAVGTTDASIRETVTDVHDAVESQWGAALVSTVSTQALGQVIAWAGLVAAIALGVLSFVKIAPGFWPLGPLPLPILVGIVAILAASTVQFAIDGVLKTALYHYARDRTLPPALSADPDAIFEVDDAPGDGRHRAAAGPDWS